MSLPAIIRAYELQKGDVFIRQGYKYIVAKISDGIKYRSLTGNLGYDNLKNIGLFSQERVELIKRNQSNSNT